MKYEILMYDETVLRLYVFKIPFKTFCGGQAYTFKGIVSRDFRPLAFFIKQPP
jgi:hypothetical protein